MTRPLDRPAATDAEIFDMLHAAFGIGDYNDDDDRPWWKVRQTEISKIKAMRTKRHLTPDDMVMLARYCAARGLRVRKPWDLLEHYPDALRDRKRSEALAYEQELERAVAIEQERGNDRWVDRLLMSRGAERAMAFEEWKRDNG